MKTMKHLLQRTDNWTSDKDPLKLTPYTIIYICIYIG